MWQKTAKAPADVTPPVIPPTVTTTPPPSISKIPADWKTYRNEKIGVSLSYPDDWFLYDRAKWEEDDKIYTCNKIGDLSKDEFILSRKNLGRCVGYGVFEEWPGDFILQATPGGCADFPYVLGQKDSQIGTLGNVQAIKYPFNKNSELPRKSATRIYSQYDNRCYFIEFLQTDNKGNYDLAFDQVLSTVKFFK